MRIKGGYGQVYKLEKDGKVFALKEILFTNREVAQYEIKIMEKLNTIDSEISPFPKLLDYQWQPPNKLLILMEFLQGEELFDLISSDDWKKLNDKDKTNFIRIICLEILRALKLLHNNGIVHRDLKLENIFIDYQKGKIKINHIKLLDFGFSCLDKDLIDDPELKDYHQNCTKLPGGTTYYLSPQMADRMLNKKNTAYSFETMKQSDIWSFGVVLYVILYNKYPFNDKKSSLILYKIINYRYFIKYPFKHPLFTPILQKIFCPLSDQINIDKIIEYLS